MVYRPIHREQIGDPTTGYDPYICTMESGAMALDFHTQGKVQVWGGNLLNKLNLSDADIRNGLNMGNLKNAWAAYGYTLLDRRGYTWAQVIKDLKAGRGIVLQGDYDVLTGDDDCQPGFNGDHAIYLNPELYSDNTVVLKGDPLCEDFDKVPLSTLKKYAEKLGARVYGPSSPQKIFFGATAAHPDDIGNGDSGDEEMKLYSTPGRYSYTVKLGAIVYDNTGKAYSTIKDATKRYDVILQDAATNPVYALLDGASSDPVTYPNGVLSGWVKFTDLLNKQEVTAPYKAQITSLTNRINTIKSKTAVFNADIQND